MPLQFLFAAIFGDALRFLQLRGFACLRCGLGVAALFGGFGIIGFDERYRLLGLFDLLGLFGFLLFFWLFGSLGRLGWLRLG